MSAAVPPVATASPAADAAGARGARPIGVFDSGIGGLSVLRALRAELPHERFVYFADSGHAPYGERDEAHVMARTAAIAHTLVHEHGAKALVVACNTATAAAIHLLRARYPGLPVVGVEPALKPAVAATRTGHIGVIATRSTLASAKFGALSAALGERGHFSLVPCDGLAHAIEQGDDDAVETLVARYLQAVGRFGEQPGEVDTLVLGCTHYPLVTEVLRRHVGAGVQLVETGPPVALQTRRLLAAAGELAAERPASSFTAGDDVVWLSSADPATLRAAAARWLPETGLRA